MISKSFYGPKHKRYCPNVEQIENYDEAIKSDKMYTCHHRLEEFFTVKELKDMGKYYNRPASELIFLTHKEHRNWPHKGFKESDNALRNLTKEQRSPGWAPEAIEKRASKRRTVLIRCIETGEIHYECWYRKNGLGNARFVADGTRKSCKGLHFEFVKQL